MGTKIVWDNNENRCFAAVKQGQSFVYDVSLFMKTECSEREDVVYNAVKLSNGDLHRFTTEEVKPVNIIITVKS
jgi:hypothetical protein